MPITKQVIKRVKQSSVRQERNLATASKYKKAVKRITKDIDAGSKTVAEDFSAVQSAIDTAAKKKVISPQKAARKKSQIARQMKEAGIKMPAKKK